MYQFVGWNHSQFSLLVVCVWKKRLKPVFAANWNHLIFSFIQSSDCIARTVTADVLLFTGMNVGALYTRFLTDRGQRNAFLETRRFLQMHYRTKKENEKQERLLLSGLVQIVCYLCSTSNPFLDLCFTGLLLKHLVKPFQLL